MGTATLIRKMKLQGSGIAGSMKRDVDLDTTFHPTSDARVFTYKDRTDEEAVGTSLACQKYSSPTNTCPPPANFSVHSPLKSICNDHRLGA